MNSLPAEQAAAEGRRQLQEEATLSIAEALELAALDSAAQQSEERKTRRRQWQYAVSRATDRITLPSSLTFGDWYAEEWAQMESMGGQVSPVATMSPGPGPYRNPSPPSSAASSISSIPDVLEPVDRPSPTPSSPSYQEPIRLLYRQATATAGPTYTFQVSASLRRQPLQERVVLSDRLREILISPAEELTLGARRHPGRPSPPPTLPPPPPPPTLQVRADAELMPPPPPPPPRTESDVRTAVSARRCLQRDGCQCRNCGSE